MSEGSTFTSAIKKVLSADPKVVERELEREQAKRAATRKAAKGKAEPINEKSRP